MYGQHKKTPQHRKPIQRRWQHWAHKTQDEDKQNTKRQHNTENQSRDAGNIGHTRHRVKTNKTQKDSTTQKTNVLSFCVLFVFILCLVCPMLPASLDWFSVLCCLFVFCLSSSCVLCAQCCQRLWIGFLCCGVFLCFVCLHPIGHTRHRVKTNKTQKHKTAQKTKAMNNVYPTKKPIANPSSYRFLYDTRRVTHMKSLKTLFIALVFCAVLCFCVLFVFTLCLVCPMLPASLDWFSVLCCLFVFCLSKIKDRAMRNPL
jgi:ABC-type multidrug transport system permease subunit